MFQYKALKSGEKCIVSVSDRALAGLQQHFLHCYFKYLGQLSLGV